MHMDNFSKCISKHIFIQIFDTISKKLFQVDGDVQRFGEAHSFGLKFHCTVFLRHFHAFSKAVRRRLFQKTAGPLKQKKREGNQNETIRHFRAS